MTVVDIPMSSWELKLVNIQRVCKDYVWDDSSSTLLTAAAFIQFEKFKGYGG